MSVPVSPELYANKRQAGAEAGKKPKLAPQLLPAKCDELKTLSLSSANDEAYALGTLSCAPSAAWMESNQPTMWCAFPTTSPSLHL